MKMGFLLFSFQSLIYMKATKIILGGLLICCIVVLKKQNNQLKKEKKYLEGYCENQKDVITGLHKDVEKWAFAFGKRSRKYSV